MNGDDRQPSGGGEVDRGGQYGDGTETGRHFGRSGTGASRDSRVEASSVAVDVLLAAAMRAHEVDAEREARAVAAFRAAREQRAGAARTRRRDDWRPRGERRAGRPLRVTLATLLAGLTFGGGAVAAIGVSSSGDDGSRGRTRPSSSVPGRSATPSDSAGATAPAPGVSPPGPSDRPSQAQDTEAQCRAYEKVDGRGKAMDATAWQRLVDAAGGVANVRAYCAELVKKTGTENGDGNGGDSGTGVGEGPAQSQGADESEGRPAASARATNPKPEKKPGKN